MFKDLFYSIENHQNTCNLNEFNVIAKEIYKGLNIEMKNLLLKKKLNNCENEKGRSEEYTFRVILMQPAINKKSVDMINAKNQNANKSSFIDWKEEVL